MNEDILGLLENNKTAIGGIIAFLFGASIRLFDRFLKKQTDDVNMAQQIRTELRSDVIEKEKHIDKLEEEVSMWKGKYWAEVEAHAVSKAELLRLQIEKLSSKKEDDEIEG